MSVDTISNFLTTVRNAIMRSKRSVDFAYSSQILRIVEIMHQEGYIRDFQIVNVSEDVAHRCIRLALKYVGGESAIHEINRISTPGCRAYAGSKELNHVAGGLGISVVTTSKGVMTDKEARMHGVGGEVLCEIW
jgi:small subunit ribosomal protein S8